MSELTVYHCNEWHNEYTEFYLKSEADKVIERILQNNHHLLDEVERLKEDVVDARQKACGFQDIINEKERRERHQKFKRCLAMAKKCRLHARWFGDNAFYKKEQWTLKWHRRWLELAEKFKEAK